MKKMLSLLIAMVMALGLMTTTAFAAEGTISGEGTAENPYLIEDLADLKAFRDSVNAGNSYAGKYIKLVNSIDLNNEEWTPIGSSSKKFEGYFDGNNKTVSNLKVSDSSADHAGFFGYIKGSGMSDSTTPSVKDLSLTNVSVTGDYYVGGLSGQGYTCNVTNVSVQGTVSGVRYVGGLIGHVYTYFKDCTFTGEASCSFDALGGIAGAGDCRAYDCAVYADVTGSNWVGGIVGNGQEGTSAVGCYVKGTVSSDSNYYRGVGGIAGVAGHGYSSSVFQNNYFDGEVYLEDEKVDAIVMGFVNAASNETINTTVEGNSWNTEYYPATTPVYVTAEVPSADATSEEWAASASETLTGERNNNLVMLESDLEYVDVDSMEDVTIMSFSEMTEEETFDAIAVAQVGEDKYLTFAEAIAAADGKTVKLLRDIELTDETFTISADTTMTLDLNGKTLSGVFFVTTSSALIKNYGDLTIEDSSAEKTGKISVLAENPDTDWNPEGFPTYANNTISNYGTLIIDGGTVENTTEGGACYAIDNYSGSVTVNGGKVYHPTKVAIRQFVNNATKENAVTVNGGEVVGGTRAVWVQLPGSNPANKKQASLTITGGTLTSNDETYNLAVYVYSYGDSAENTQIEISGGVIEGNVGINATATGTMPEGAVSVTGGAVNGEYGVFSYAEEDTNDAIIISGGSFAAAPESEYVAEGFIAKKSGDRYGIVETDEVVSDPAGIYAEDPRPYLSGEYVAKQLADGTWKVYYDAPPAPTTKEPVNPFADVDKDDYYYEAVLWAVKNGITNGVEDDVFAPDLTCTRAQVVTFLWRAAGSPVPKSYENPFTDLDEDAYYYSAVLWAVEQGITKGTGDGTTFSPYATVTRAQAVTFLWRAAGAPKSDRWNSFEDVSSADYYHDAVVWAVVSGVTSGKTAATFEPDTGCTRGNIVTFLYRHYN